LKKDCQKLDDENDSKKTKELAYINSMCKKLNLY